MNPTRRTLIALTVLAALLAGCDPQENGSCDNQGEFWTKVDSRGNRTSLACTQTGVDSHGKPILRWVKA